MASVLIAVAQFTSFTYIRPYLEEQAGFEAAWSGPLLFVFGVMGIVGVGLAGVLVDSAGREPRSPGRSCSSPSRCCLLTLWPRSRVLVVTGAALWGLAMGAVFPPSSRPRSCARRPNGCGLLASAGVIVFFNVGIGVGPWLGGALDGALPATANTAVSAATMVLLRRRTPPSRAASLGARAQRRTGAWSSEA